jgi:hypothetical protein
MCGEFSEIYQLCKEVLDNATKTSLIKATLQTLLRFLNWIPLGFIFEVDLIDTLTNRVSSFENSLCMALWYSSSATVSGSCRIPQCYAEMLDRDRLIRNPRYIQ